MAVTFINRQLRSHVDSYDHASRSAACSYDRCIGAVMIILPENKIAISLILNIIGYFVRSQRTTNYISIWCANYMCLRGMQVWQSGPAPIQPRRRPPSCMIVTAMIVAVSPQCLWVKLCHQLHLLHEPDDVIITHEYLFVKLLRFLELTFCTFDYS